MVLIIVVTLVHVTWLLVLVIQDLMQYGLIWVPIIVHQVGDEHLSEPH